METLVRTVLLAALVCMDSSIGAWAEMAHKRAFDKTLTPHENLQGVAEQNYVLKAMQFGLDYFSVSEFDHASYCFDQAIARIESVFIGGEEAAKARSLWYEEGKKVFKGEPYERAMVYYYRGLLELLTGQPDNARATFESGILQDAFAEESQFRSDFALLMYLSAWSSKLMDNQSLFQEAVTELQLYRNGVSGPGPQDNVLVIVETGKAPRKLADGVGQFELVYRRGGENLHNTADLLGAKANTRLSLLEDIYWQATTRGGRAVDRIVAGKVQFRDEMAASGSAISSVASTAMKFTENTGLNDKLALFGVIGVAQIALASEVDTRVDTRYWPNLPDLVFATTTKVDSAEMDPSLKIHVSYDGLDLGDAPIDVPVHFNESGYGLAWVRI